MTDRKAGPSQRPLAELLAYIEGSARQRGESDPPAEGVPGHDAGDLLRKSYPELPLLDEFKTTWIKLSANRQLERAQEQVPDNAGPLHSSRLVTQALALMQEISPAYLHTFMAYVDALSWTQQMLSERASSQDGARSALNRAAAKGGAKEAVTGAAQDPAKRSTTDAVSASAKGPAKSGPKARRPRAKKDEAS